MVIRHSNPSADPTKKSRLTPAYKRLIEIVARRVYESLKARNQVADTVASPESAPRALEQRRMRRASVMNSAVVLTHERFQRPPVPPQRRRGRLPEVVTCIPHGSARLRPGDRAELVLKREGDLDNAKRVQVIDVDLRDDRPIHVKSLDALLHCEDETLSLDLWVKAAVVRRLWRGLTERERIQLRLLRGAS